MCVGGGYGVCTDSQNNDNIYFTFNFQYNGHPTRLVLKVISRVHPLFKFSVMFVNLPGKLLSGKSNFVVVVALSLKSQIAPVFVLVLEFDHT